MNATGFGMLFALTLWADLGPVFAGGSNRVAAIVYRRVWWVAYLPTGIAAGSIAFSGRWAAAALGVLALACTCFALARIRPEWDSAVPKRGHDDRYWQRVGVNLLTWLVIWLGYFAL